MDFSVLALRSAIASGSLTSEALVRECLARIRRLNPVVNAFSQVFEEEALEEARACDREAAQGHLRGPLHGIPMGVKDLFFVADRLCQRGSAAYKNFAPKATAPIVQRMIDAGSIMIGKTTTTEMGWSGSGHSEFYGPTRNPWNPELTSGGSSSGSGAALAARMVPFTLGSDGGGSVRIPAAFCGVFAMKGTLGRVPTWPWSATEMLSHAGPMSVSAKDSALLFNIAKGPDPRDHQALPDDGADYTDPRPIRALRVGFTPSLFGFAVVPDVDRVIREAVATLSGALDLDIRPVLLDWQDPIRIFETLWVAGRGVAYGAEADLSAFGSGFRGLVEASTRYDLADYLSAAKARADFAGSVHALFEDIDLLLLPTVPVEPFAADREAPEGFSSPSEVLAWTGWTPFTYPFNLSGNPAASLPAGLTVNGLPVGLQVVGRRHADALVMAFCQRAEDHLFHNKLPPLVVAGDKAGRGTASNPTAEISSWNSTGEHS
ncbi:amidase family protein [Shinella sp. 838]|uniref:amidase n=1 Tax=unclassified Shinella TaxID=2643062 RepID=UPI0003C55A9B|nr:MULTISPECIES: amidase family protein [unclassified Shinella]EYR82866.1 Asp-tRNAAsn/Glu-tRNAGln amidotransferase A [Shinella sp. DD12]MCA0341278.1 amidase [Pseudomonadota bacterium]MDG4673607.1 amidase family protein [Shinella sp. 838]